MARDSDLDVAFQRQPRELLAASVKANIAAPRDLAHLSDRIAVTEKRPQEYGTQFTKTDRCHLQLGPVDDMALANGRRLAIAPNDAAIVTHRLLP